MKARSISPRVSSLTQSRPFATSTKSISEQDLCATLRKIDRMVCESSATSILMRRFSIADLPSAPLPKFMTPNSPLRHELRKQRGTSKSMVLVPLYDLKFLNELAGGAVGTSNRRH